MWNMQLTSRRVMYENVEGAKRGYIALRMYFRIHKTKGWLKLEDPGFHLKTGAQFPTRVGLIAMRCKN